MKTKTEVKVEDCIHTPAIQRILEKGEKHPALGKLKCNRCKDRWVWNSRHLRYEKTLRGV